MVTRKQDCCLFFLSSLSQIFDNVLMTMFSPNLLQGYKSIKKMYQFKSNIPSKFRVEVKIVFLLIVN